MIPDLKFLSPGEWEYLGEKISTETFWSVGFWKNTQSQTRYVTQDGKRHRKLSDAVNYVRAKNGMQRVGDAVKPTPLRDSKMKNTQSQKRRVERNIKKDREEN